MNPNNVKLTLKQSIKPLFNSLNHPFVGGVCATVFVIGWLIFVAFLFPVLIPSSAILNALVCFSCSVLIHLLTVLPLLIFGMWWTDEASDGGQRMFNDFKDYRNRVFFEAKKKVLDNVIDDELLKK